jgi:hypothetical protein
MGSARGRAQLAREPPRSSSRTTRSQAVFHRNGGIDRESCSPNKRTTNVRSVVRLAPEGEVSRESLSEADAGVEPRTPRLRSECSGHLGNKEPWSGSAGECGAVATMIVREADPRLRAAHSRVGSHAPNERRSTCVPAKDMAPDRADARNRTSRKAPKVL